MDVERTIQTILNMQAKAEARAEKADGRMDKAEARMAAHDARMAAQGIRNPARMTAALAPGFPA